MFSVNRFFPSVIAMTMGSFLCVSCGSGSSGSSSSTDSTSSGDSSATTYDSSTGLYNTTCGTTDNSYISSYLSPDSSTYGFMLSDIASNSSITACSSGQFVFNGQCYDSISFDDSKGAIYFTKNGNSQLISQSDTALTTDMVSYGATLYSQGVDYGCNMTTSNYGACSSINFLDEGSDSPFGLLQFSWYNSSQSTDFYPYGDTSTKNYASLYSFNVNFKMNYGSCYDGNSETTKMSYVWYINGTVTLNGQQITVSPSNPLSESIFLSIYPSATSSLCSPFYVGSNKNTFTCYQVETTWGSYVMYFDASNNFSHIEVDYNPTNIEVN